MMLKHLTFGDVNREPWIKSQELWLAGTRASGGLLSAYGAEMNGKARAVFRFENTAACDRFMASSHTGLLTSAGRVGQAWPLYLDVIDDVGTTAGAGFVGETTSWVKEHGINSWLESYRIWTSAMRRIDGFIGCCLGRGRRSFVFASFWRDEAAHLRFERENVPYLRARTSGDQVTARLTRFAAPLISSLTWSAEVSKTSPPTRASLMPGPITPPVAEADSYSPTSSLAK